jgi:hypothetical protein
LPQGAVASGFGQRFGTQNGENRCAVNCAAAVAHSLGFLTGLSATRSPLEARAWARQNLDPFLRFSPPERASEGPSASDLLVRLFAAADVPISLALRGLPIFPPQRGFFLHEPAATDPFQPLRLEGVLLEPRAVIYHQPGVHFVCCVSVPRLGAFCLLDDSRATLVAAPPPPPTGWETAAVLYIVGPRGAGMDRPRRVAATAAMDFISGVAAEARRRHRRPESNDGTAEEPSEREDSGSDTGESSEEPGAQKAKPQASRGKQKATEGDAGERATPASPQTRDRNTNTRASQQKAKPTCSCGRAPGRQGRHNKNCARSASSGGAGAATGPPAGIDQTPPTDPGLDVQAVLLKGAAVCFTSSRFFLTPTHHPHDSHISFFHDFHLAIHFFFFVH